MGRCPASSQDRVNFLQQSEGGKVILYHLTSLLGWGKGASSEEEEFLPGESAGQRERWGNWLQTRGKERVGTGFLNWRERWDWRGRGSRWALSVVGSFEDAQ